MRIHINFKSQIRTQLKLMIWKTHQKYRSNVSSCLFVTTEQTFYLFSKSGWSCRGQSHYSFYWKKVLKSWSNIHKREKTAEISAWESIISFINEIFVISCMYSGLLWPSETYYLTHENSLICSTEGTEQGITILKK